MVKDLNKLVLKLIESFPVPERDRDDADEDGAVAVFWYSKDPGTHCVTLEACEHRILLTASYDDLGPCPPEIECTYSHTRLAMLLNWMERHGSVDELYGLLRDGAFHQKYESDPPITKHMYSGRVTDSVWYALKRIENASL